MVSGRRARARKSGDKSGLKFRGSRELQGLRPSQSISSFLVPFKPHRRNPVLAALAILLRFEKFP